MVLNDAGKMVQYWWGELQNKFPNISVETFIVMPNHMYGVICIVGADRCVGPEKMVINTSGGHIGPPLPKMIQWYKTMSTNEYIKNVKNHHWSPFTTRLWQRNYHERIVRNDDEYGRICEYIAMNPENWDKDEENPEFPFFPKHGKKFPCPFKKVFSPINGSIQFFSLGPSLFLWLFLA
jgi:REP element-mobilizing transposase RayT